MSEKEPYERFAERLVATGLVPDPWVEGQPRFRAEPAVLSPAEVGQLYQAAEAVAMVVDEATRLCTEDTSLLDEFIALSPFQKLMWASSCPLWHGLARADVFFTNDGISVCELNSDTPTGEAETLALARTVGPDWPQLVDPNENLADNFCDMVEAMAGATIEGDFPKHLGIVYPTDLPEDLPLIQLYREWFESRGWRVALGSPYNLVAGEEGRPSLLGVSCSVLLRHYKTDWWGERLGVWDDESPFPDSEPLHEPLRVTLESVLERRLCVVNPFGSVLSQNKRLFALLWEEIDRFSDESAQIIKQYIPFTSRLEALHAPQLSVEKDDWVLKSDYGCEGAEVIIGKYTTQEIWDASLRLASRGRWVAQKYFETKVDSMEYSYNYGVYVIGGTACGLYTRAQKGPTDGYAESVASLINPKQSVTELNVDVNAKVTNATE